MLRPSGSTPATMPEKHLWILMGPSGAGKSRIGRHLQDTHCLTFLEGDDYLSSEDKQCIASTHTLHNANHPYWLHSLIRAAISHSLHSSTIGVAVACSALRLQDRTAWREAVAQANADNGHAIPSNLDARLHYTSNYSPSAAKPFIHLHFLYLQITERLARQVVANRQARDRHFMPEMAVPAQFRALEPPDGRERDCVVLFSEVTAELKDMAERHVGEVLGAGVWVSEAVEVGG